MASKQEQVIELVKEGKHTREQIKEQVGCTTGSLASYLSTMTNIAKYTESEMCPMADENGIMTATTFAEAEKLKAERMANRKPAAAAKTPAERFEAAEKRIIRCANALDSAKNRAEDNEDNREMQLRFLITEINAELAHIELARATDLVNAADAADEAPEAAEDDLM